jgi:hypothetical protein
MTASTHPDAHPSTYQQVKNTCTGKALTPDWVMTTAEPIPNQSINPSATPTAPDSEPMRSNWSESMKCNTNYINYRHKSMIESGQIKTFSEAVKKVLYTDESSIFFVTSSTLNRAGRKSAAF